MTKSQSDEELPSKKKDTIFKLLFTKTENKEILKNFLEKIFMQRISYVTLNSSNKAVLDAIVKINDNLCCESCHKILSDNMEVYIINLPPLFKKLETNNILDIIKFIELSNSQKIGKYNTIQNILKINESYFYN